jgi:hypothetical protein
MPSYSGWSIQDPEPLFQGQFLCLEPFLQKPGKLDVEGPQVVDAHPIEVYLFHVSTTIPDNGFII